MQFRYSLYARYLVWCASVYRSLFLQELTKLGYEDYRYYYRSYIIRLLRLPTLYREYVLFRYGVQLEYQYALEFTYCDSNKQHWCAFS